MTISSSLNASVAGLNVNGTRLATISDNIANSATNGYKRAVTDFQSLVAGGGGGGVYSAGGVRAHTYRLIDERGSLTTSTNATDLAISGRGMIPVASVAGAPADGALPLALVPTGSFRADANGFLRNEAGMVLLGWPFGPDGNVIAGARDSGESLRPVRVGLGELAGEPTTRIDVALNLPATATDAAAAGDPYNLSVEYFGNLGTSERLEMVFEPVIPATGTSNTWRLSVLDHAADGAEVASFEVTFNDERGLGGRILSVTELAGGTYDADAGEIAFEVAGGPMALSIGRPGVPGGLSQLSDRFAPISISKNGSPVGNLTAIEVDRTGVVQAIYDVGLTRPVFQVPVVDVPNPNGLMPVGNGAYQVSPQSGSFLLWQAGTGPVGEMLGFSREESATDVAAELTRLIQTQRAYSSNAKVIQAVDEMLQETTNIKR